jgi:hypothetical protein
MSLRLIDTRDDYLKGFNPDIAVDIYCGLTGQCLEGEAKRHLL